LDRLREELAEFGGPGYNALYRRWRDGGDAVLGESSESLSKSSGGFGIYRLDHEYELFGDVGREISA
jgi:hypothetical protein